MRRRALAAVSLAAASTAAACAQQVDLPDAVTGDDAAGGFAATEDYLAGAATASRGLSYRMAMDMTMSFDADGEHVEIGGPLMTGETDGDRTSMAIDMGEVFRDLATASGEPLPPGFTRDLTMEMVVDGDTLYLRAPYFAAIAEAARDLEPGTDAPALGPLDDLAALGDGWGSVDIAQVSPSEVASAAGGQTTDPGVYLDVVARGTDVQELGARMVGGVATRGLGATITYADMVEAQGIDLDDLRRDMTEQLGPDAQGMFERITRLEVPVEAWVDDGDLVRRVHLQLDMGPLLDSAPSVGMASAGQGAGQAGLSMRLGMDFSDYDDDSIAITVPTGAVDVTDHYLALIEGGGIDTGLGPSQITET